MTRTARRERAPQPEQPAWRNVGPGEIEMWQEDGDPRWFVAIGRKSGTRYLCMTAGELARLRDAITDALAEGA